MTAWFEDDAGLHRVTFMRMKDPFEPIKHATGPLGEMPTLEQAIASMEFWDAEGK